MIKFEELNQLHLEITNNCQASCPMCTRNVHGGVPNDLLKLTSWSLKKYKTILDSTVLHQVSSVFFCGNYGDPLLNNHLLEMIEYSTGINPNLNIRVHTNGSLRNTKWWEKLASVMPEKHLVVFAIDGLEDTNHIYRIGTDYNKIIENATAFIKAGGKAEWAYIRFKHNEHQVEQAKSIARELGFFNFVMKDSSRFLLETKFPVYDKNKNTIYNLEPSTYSQIKFIDRKVIQNYKLVVKEAKIECHAIKMKEAYINAQGYLFPCCWLAMIPYQKEDEEIEVVPIRREILNQYYDLVENLGGIESLNAETNHIKNIINSNFYQTVWDKYWNEKKLITCARTCGKLPHVFSTPADQFVSKELLTGR